MMVLLGLLWVPFIGYISSQLTFICKASGLHQSADLRVLYSRNPLARLNGAGAITSLLTVCMGATRFILELADRAGGSHFSPPRFAG